MYVRRWVFLDREPQVIQWGESMFSEDDIIITYKFEHLIK